MTMPQAQPQPQRAQRECDECHEVDDLGHHQVVVPEDGGLVVHSRHFKCCASLGCPDGSCDEILRSTEK
jgi:hypothetical protein